MLRTDDARVSGIFVDTCGRHGTWADHGEALRLIELFQDGGSDCLRDIAARREREDLNRSCSAFNPLEAANAAELRALDIRSRVHMLLDWFDFL